MEARAEGAEGDRRRRRAIVAAAALAACLPVLAVALQAASDGWYPIGDDAFTAVAALDVLTERSTLVGQWSSGASAVLDRTVYSPGPLVFWLLALPARLPDPRWLAVTAGLVNAACLAGTVALAARRGGLGFALVVAVALP